MAPLDFERTQDLDVDWGHSCVAYRDPHTHWKVARNREHGTGWTDEVRERVAHQSRRRAERPVGQVIGELGGDNQTVSQQFDALAATWRAETIGAPFLITRVAHWAYQRIIGMGPDVLPLVLRELEERTDHWFWALNAISGVDPAEGIEDFQQAAATWLEWGRSTKLLN